MAAAGSATSSKTLFGARSGYRVRKLPQVTSWAECFSFLRDDAAVEVPCGAGRVVFSQLEATRRFAEDPVATRYLANLFRYCLGRRSAARRSRRGGLTVRTAGDGIRG